MVIIVMFVLSIIFVAFLNTGLAETNFSIGQERHSKAYYLARSGAAGIAYQILFHPKTTTAMHNVTYNIDNAVDNLDGNVSVHVLKEVDNDVVLTSTGTTLTNDIRIVKLKLHYMTAQDIFKYAIFTDSNLDITGMNLVNGPVASNGTITSDGTVIRNGYEAGDLEYAELTFVQDPFPTLTEYADIYANPSTALVKIDQSGYYPDINSNADILEFDTSDGDMEIVVDDIYVKGDLQITGGNSLSLYVKNSANFQTPTLINDDNPDLIVIHLADNSSLTFQAGMSFKGYVYGPGASVVDMAGATVVGAIIADNFYGNGNPDITYQAPGSEIPLGEIEAYRIDEWSK